MDYYGAFGASSFWLASLDACAAKCLDFGYSCAQFTYVEGGATVPSPWSNSSGRVNCVLVDSNAVASPDSLDENGLNSASYYGRGELHARVGG